MNRFYYSLNSGASWEGPFSQIEINNLRAAGIIDANTLLREEPAAQQAPPIHQAGSYTAPPPHHTSPQPSPQANHDRYTVLVNGIPQGPYDIPTILQLLQAQQIRLSDLAWKDGMSDWLPLSTILPGSTTNTISPNLDNFSLKHFFSEVFKSHTQDEMYDCFIAGTRQGTPPLSAVSATFPAPWIFARFMLFSLILYFGFGWAFSHYQNPKLVPGLIFVGNFGIPFCIFLLFYELNIRRDVPLYKGIVALIGGGLISLIATCFLFSNTSATEAYWAGPIEEPAKLLAVLLIAGRLRNGRILTGILMGAAVGAGFAAFESAGYTYNDLVELISHGTAASVISNYDPNKAQAILKQASQFDPDFVMRLRALLTPFGHVVWTAITAGAYWLVMSHKIHDGQRDKNDTGIDFSILIDMRFLLLALVSVILHMIWNSNIMANFGIFRFIILGIVAWIFVLRLVGAGIAQIAHEKSQKTL